MIKFSIKIVVLLLVVSNTINLYAQQFTFSGNISNAPIGARLFMTYTNIEGQTVTDSCMLQNGFFSIKGKIGNPQAAFLRVFIRPYYIVSDDSPNAKSLFIEPGNITADGDYNQFQSLKITGSATNIEYEAFKASVDQTKPQHDQLMAVIDKRNKLKKVDSDDGQLHVFNKTIDSLREKLLSTYDNIYKPFVATHPNSFVAGLQLAVQKSRWPLVEVKKYYSAFTPQIQQGTYGAEIRKYIESKDDNVPGHSAKNFTAIDFSGKKLNLADFKGKYVILDFWASWCVPCRESTPHLIALYNKYHTKGLEVIAIADDDATQKAWKAAIQKDNSTLWNNILRGRNQYNHENDISDRYGISLLPTKILIDDKGTIIARYTGTEEALAIDKKLAEVFK